MRFSRYNILTRKLSDGNHVLLNSLSGMMDLIDEEAYDIITSHSDDDELSQEILTKISAVQDDFIERGYLTNLSREGELLKAEEHALKLADKVTKISDDKWAVVLIPSLACNYRCTYCFERNSGYPAVMMSKQQVDSIFDLIKDKITPGHYMTLYGGEPLARENRGIIEYIFEKGAAFKQTFFAVTNGHDLNYYMDLLGSDKIRQLQISIDGPKIIHNQRRISRDGVSSYDKLMHNIETALAETDVHITLRINLDKRNAPYVMELMDDLDGRGILDNPVFNVACNVVTGVGDLTARHDDIRPLEEAVEAKYPRYKDMFMGYTVVSSEAVLPALLFGQAVLQRVSVCGAPDGMKVFSPDGHIYSCWSVIGDLDQTIGTFDCNGNIYWNRKVLNRWKKSMLAYNRKCLGCKYGFICAGGCHKFVLMNETSDGSYDCDYHKYMFDEYLARIIDESLAVGNE